MSMKMVGTFVARSGFGVVIAVACGLWGCSGAERSDAADQPEPEVGEVQQAVSTSWVNLTLRNGWKAAANSNTPAIRLVNDIVTFRGALDGTNATSEVAFCLTIATPTSPSYTAFRPTDGGYLTVRAAMGNAALGSLMLDFPFSGAIPETNRYCMHVLEDGASPQPGPNAKKLTSLEGVSYDKSYADSIHLDYAPYWGSAYPMRGSDSTINPGGAGIFVKLVNGFARFQGVLAGFQDAPNLLFTLPPNKGLIPAKPVYVPVTLSPSQPLQGRIVIQTNGDVQVEGIMANAWSGVSLDGASYSMSSPPEAKPLSLSSGWVAYSTRAVRYRLDNNVVRLEGAVKNGTTMTIGTLPAGYRPAKKVFVVANAIQFAQPAQLSIDTAGVIQIEMPALVAAAPGLSLDGVSFAL